MRIHALIRTLLPATAALAMLAAAASAFEETHLHEIAAPAKTYADQRVAELDQISPMTKEQAKERKLLAKLSTVVGKLAFRLKDDVKELQSAAKTQKKLNAAGAGLEPALQFGFTATGLSLSERRELLDDYLELLFTTKKIAKIRKVATRYESIRASADAAPTNDNRAALLVKAEAEITKALRQAEKQLLREQVEGKPLPPPTRFRSGDVIRGGGGRVAIPRDSGSPLAGLSVVIPLSALTLPTAITIDEIPGFVGDPHTAGGIALRVSPVGIDLNAPATIFLPFELPPGGDSESVAMFRNDAGGLFATLAVTQRVDGTLSAQTSRLGDHQAGLLAPAPGTPGGVFRMQTLTLLTSIPESNQPLQKVTDSFAVSDRAVVRFRADGTGNASSGALPSVGRQFNEQSPHHIDFASSTFSGAFDFTWTSPTPGVFDIAFEFQPGLQATGKGVLSQDGRVLVMSGHGQTFDFLSVGIRGAEGFTAGNADMAGRWFAVEVGAELANPGATMETPFTTPFVTRRFAGYTWFDADGTGTLTYDPLGKRFHSEMTYDTSVGVPTHNHAAATSSEARNQETFTVAPTGQFQDTGRKRFGWLDPTAGLLMTYRLDSDAREVVWQIAVRQPNPGQAGVFQGVYGFAGLGIGTSASAPPTTASSHFVRPFAGTLDHPGIGDTTHALDAGPKTTYALSGPPPVTNLVWSMVATQGSDNASFVTVPIVPDAAGNHLPDAEARGYGVSGDGALLLGLEKGFLPDLLRGIFVGVRR